jgi:zinc transporter 5/7
MASSYALPASAMTHSHHGHGHVHSHSHSPGRQPQYSANTPRTLRQEKSNGSLHAHSHSEPHHEHDHSHLHGHSHDRESSPSRYLPTPPYSNGLAPAPFEKKIHESSPALSQQGTYEPPLNAVNVLPHDHDHHDHHEHSHAPTHAKSVEPRSRFTSFILPFVQRWPLLHTIMSDKDSRRIFYFMR